MRGARRARASIDGLGLGLGLDLRRLDHRRGRRRATCAGVGGKRGDDGVVRGVGGAGAGRVATRAARRLGGDEEWVSSERARSGDARRVSMGAGDVGALFASEASRDGVGVGRVVTRGGGGVGDARERRVFTVGDARTREESGVFVVDVERGRDGR